MKPRTPPPPTRSLAGLLLLMGTLAVVGGLGLTISNGRWFGLPTTLLEQSPFASYVVPGLVLALVVGGAQLVAGVAVWRRRPRHLRAAVVAAAVLAGWIAIQAVMIGVFWLQPVVFIIAIMELGMVAASLPARPTRSGRKRR